MSFENTHSHEDHEPLDHERNMEQIQEEIFSQISKFENTPVDIEYIWFNIKITNKFDFIRGFYNMPKIYSSVYLKYKSGIPFLVYTDKDLWEFSETCFVPIPKDINLENEENFPSHAKITLFDLIDFHIRTDYPEMDSDLMNKVIEEGDIRLLNIVLREFHFSDKDYDYFLNRLFAQNVEANNEVMKTDAKGDKMEMIILIMKTKYKNKIRTLETSIHDLKWKNSKLNDELMIYRSREQETNQKSFLQRLFYL